MEKNDAEGSQEVKKILSKIKKAFKSNDSMELRRISNQSIEKAMMTREPRLVEISLISYGLSKILRKPHYQKVPGWKRFKKEIEEELSKTEKEKGRRLDEVIEIIHRFNEEAGNYVEGVIDHARVKQASRLYALGLSLNSASELTETSEEQLLQYIGSTRISEKHRTTKSASERYEKMKELIE